MIAAKQDQNVFLINFVYEGFDLTIRRGATIHLGKIIDRLHAGGGEFFRLVKPGAILDRGQHALRLLDVRGITTLTTRRDPVFSRIASQHEFNRSIAAHHARGRFDRNNLKPESLEHPAIRFEVLIEGVIEPSLIQIEGIGILHGEFADAQQAALRPCFVAELRLKLIPDLRQRLIRTQLRTMKRKNLFMRHSKSEVCALAILQAEHLFPHRIPAT